MPRWDYGPEGDRFPVADGQWWECGHHLYRCGDIHGLAVAERPDVIYVDPPWNTGNVRSFYTKAGLPHPEWEWTELYRVIIALAEGFGCALWVEGGVRQRDEFMAMLPGPHTASWPITYYRKHPAVLAYSGPIPPPVPDLSGSDDEHTPKIVLSAYVKAAGGEVGLVLDPCAGRGLTSRAAEQNGWRSVSNELNPTRVSVALARMEKMIGQVPERIA